MNIRLHANATTTPKTRAYIQASSKGIQELANELRISVNTVHHWRGRDDVHDRSHTRKNLLASLSEAQEAIVVELRRTLRRPLDDLLAVTREFIHPALSRSALDRCLRRNGVARLADLAPAEPCEAVKAKPFKAYEPGYIHIDYKYLPQMPDESGRRYLFVAIDRATRWVYVEIKAHKDARSATAFLKAVRARAPFRIRKLLTDNDKAFTDRLHHKRRQPTQRHVFDRLCEREGIEHRLSPVRHPQTNGMVERFNGRISEVLATHRFDSRDDLGTTIKRYSHLYNHHIPQKALGQRTPIQAMKDWQQSHPQLFTRQVRNHAGPDT
ncbi:IS481 family transposase [Spiribacter vilamensis]|uniref:Integrase-like protein n=1 Tax=Spiribacter vilamensis TaxID=531306 RepID=A0A4Q8D2L7_9GAMM|nr:IS481 family transposase [Spiribacter vilamensis]RZU99603.1 integrase-like protein [Spiribacter vilamensis]TVO61435.1 IS481 family transposase [Spiribacter vilamensis]